jgi:hypothetical protein
MTVSSRIPRLSNAAITFPISSSITEIIAA